MTLNDLELSVRAVNCLESEGITTARADRAHAEGVAGDPQFERNSLEQDQGAAGRTRTAFEIKPIVKMSRHGATTETTVTLAEAKALIRCLAHEESLLAALHARRGQVRRDPAGGRRGRPGMPQSARHADRPRGRRRRAEGGAPAHRLLPAARGPPRGRPAVLPVPRRTARLRRPTCKRRSTRCCWNDESANIVCPKAPGWSRPATAPRTRRLSKRLSSALINRLFILPIRVDVAGWLAWAEANAVRAEVRAFIQYVPQALCRPVPRDPVPFSTPRAWAMLARDLDLAERAGENTAAESPGPGVRPAQRRKTRACSAPVRGRAGEFAADARSTCATPHCCRSAAPPCGSWSAGCARRSSARN